MMEYKGYKIEGDRTFGMFLIKTIGAGSLPDVLKGSFTRTSEAQLAINRYRSEQEERDNRPAPIKKVKLTPREVNDGTAEDNDGDS